jgi:hypothetical protein
MLYVYIVTIKNQHSHVESGVAYGFRESHRNGTLFYLQCGDCTMAAVVAPTIPVAAWYKA